jgi:hypothetical protein
VKNPAAFPMVIPDAAGGANECNEGMSLRDYFAAAAITGLLATYQNAANPEPSKASQYAYAIADAMLQARAKGQAVMGPKEFACSPTQRELDAIQQSSTLNQVVEENKILRAQRDRLLIAVSDLCWEAQCTCASLPNQTKCPKCRALPLIGRGKG